MPVHITGESMTGDLTAHTARPDGNGWLVSWLPGRTLDHGAAVTAMMLAETCARCAGADNLPASVAWWAAELGLAPETAVEMASVPPDGTVR